LNRIRNYNDIIVIVIVWLLFFAILFSCHIRWSYTNNIIHNPTFTGTVVETEITTQLITKVWRIPVHRLHIIGEYIKDDEVIQVDHVFVVSAEMFYRFEEGDIVSHRQD